MDPATPQAPTTLDHALEHTGDFHPNPNSSDRDARSYQAQEMRDDISIAHLSITKNQRLLKAKGDRRPDYSASRVWAIR